MRGRKTLAALLHELFDLLWALKGGRHGLTAWELSKVCEHALPTTYRELGRALELGWVRKGTPRRAQGKDRVAATWWLTAAGEVMLVAWSKAHEYLRLDVLGGAR